MAMAIYDIFISYSRKDSIEASHLVNILQNKGFVVWYDQSGILSGDAFKRVLAKAISDAYIILFLSSTDSNRSEWTAKELGIAVDEKKKIIPIKLDRSPYNIDLRLDLINLDYVNFYDPEVKKTELTRLIRSIEQLRMKNASFSSKSSRLYDNADLLYKRALKFKNSDSDIYLKYLREAAEEGSVKAQINLGISLLRSRNVRLENEGFGWLVLASKANNASAIYNIGLCYEKGIGITMDKKESVAYYRKSGMMGHAKSQYKLGVYYAGEAMREDGTYMDLSMARHWLRLSADQGCEQAVKKLEQLSK